ncbi:MAG: MFS transporter [Clostridia bacterium]|nr:MFS transporter [Clostridia bacterium]
MHSLAGRRSLLAAITFTLWFGLYVYNPFMTPYLLSLQITATAAGVIVGAYGISQMILRLAIGVSADLLQKHRLFVTMGTLSTCIASLLRFFFVSPYLLFAANVLSGVGASAWVSYTILNSLYYDKGEMSRSLGILNAFNNGGVLVGNLVSGILYQNFGMRSLFLVSFLVSGAGTVMSLFVRDEPAVPAAITWKDCLKQFGQPRLIAFSGLLILFQIICFSTCNSFASTLFTTLQFSPVQLSLCTAMFMFSSTVSSFLVSLRCVQRIPQQLLLLLLFGLLALYCFLLSEAKTFAACLAVQFLGGMGCASLFTLLLGNSLAEIPQQFRSTAMGFAQSVYSIGIITGPIIMGRLVDTVSLLPAFRMIVFPALLGCAAAPLCYLYFRKRREKTQAAD